MAKSDRESAGHVTFKCRNCFSALRAPRRLVGSKKRCPRCLTEVEIPAESWKAPTEEDGYAIARGDAGDVAAQDYVTVRCPVCQTRVDAPRSEVGKRTPCPECDTMIHVVPLEKVSQETRRNVIYEGSDIFDIHEGVTVPFLHRRKGPRVEDTPPRSAVPDAPPTIPPAREADPASLPLVSPPAARRGPPPDIPVVCPVCSTRMYATPDEVGSTKTCPDCYTKVRVYERSLLSEETPSREPSPEVKPFEIVGGEEAAGGIADAWKTQGQRRKLIPARCTLCHTLLYAEENQVGRQVPCPDCDTMVEIPDLPPDARVRLGDADPNSILAVFGEPAVRPKYRQVKDYRTLDPDHPLFAGSEQERRTKREVLRDQASDDQVARAGRQSETTGSQRVYGFAAGAPVDAPKRPTRPKPMEFLVDREARKSNEEDQGVARSPAVDDDAESSEASEQSRAQNRRRKRRQRDEFAPGITDRARRSLEDRRRTRRAEEKSQREDAKPAAQDAPSERPDRPRPRPVPWLEQSTRRQASGIHHEAEDLAAQVRDGTRDFLSVPQPYLYVLGVSAVYGAGHALFWIGGSLKIQGGTDSVGAAALGNILLMAAIVVLGIFIGLASSLVLSTVRDPATGAAPGGDGPNFGFLEGVGDTIYLLMTFLTAVTPGVILFALLSAIVLPSAESETPIRIRMYIFDLLFLVSLYLVLPFALLVPMSGAPFFSVLRRDRHRLWKPLRQVYLLGGLVFVGVYVTNLLLRAIPDEASDLRLAAVPLVLTAMVAYARIAGLLGYAAFLVFEEDPDSYEENQLCDI